MKRLKNMFSNGYGAWHLCLALVLFGALVLTNVFWKPERVDFKTTQSKFLKQEKKTELAAKNILLESLQGGGFSKKEDTTLIYHVYQNDSLKYWSSNKMPVPKLASLSFPSEGLVHLKNGWYYTSLAEHQGHVVAASFLVKQRYRYQNEYLQNQVSKEISPSFFLLTLDEEEGQAILNNNGEYCFSISKPVYNSKTKSTSLLFLGLISLAFLFLSLRQLKNPLAKRTGLIAFFSSIYLLSLSGLLSSDVVSAQLFAYNAYIPNVFSVFVLFSALGFLLVSSGVKKVFIKKVPPIFQVVFLVPLWWLVEGTIPFVLKNSSIPIGLDNLFELELFSYIIIFFYVLLFLAYNSFFKSVFEDLIKGRGSRLVSVLFVACILSVILEIFVFNSSSLSIGLPLCLTATGLFFLNKNAFKQRLLRSVFSTVFLSAALVSQISLNDTVKDLETRRVLAKKVLNERDRELEIKYKAMTQELEASPFLLNTSRRKQENLTPSRFSYVLEHKFFKGFWEGYECSFNFYNADQKGIVIRENMSFSDWEKLIDIYGKASEICPNVYFIPSSKNGFNYIVRQAVRTSESKQSVLFIGLKSKLIPEEIGFPRLLISNKAHTLDYLKKYSIAKYKEGKLFKSFGSYSYPVYLNTYSEKVSSNIIFEGQSHYVLRGVNKNAVVLSKKQPEGLAFFTPYAYIFCLMGIIRLLFLLLSRNSNDNEKQAVSLAFKIQAILVSMVVLSLFLFGAGSGLFVKNQYKNYNKRVINEKLQSVSEELKNKIAKMERFDIAKDGVFLEKTLNKLSRVFLTDINIYDSDGFLVSSSRQQIFNLGLLSKQINANAFESLSNREKVHFSQQENIGKLSYTSSYMPVYNKELKTLGYINLQHFGQQEDYETQIQGFLVAIINVFMFLLALSIILSLVISNWLTQPLQVLQDSLSKLRLGEPNKKIAYIANDEIGSIVRLYNEKIEELERAADQLTRTERESAWREMAKQVAHEIKNPLTPMKLSVQHLLRSYDVEDPEGSLEKIKKVVDGVIEQIDGLARIANEFSNFARMPEPQKQPHDLVQLIENTLVVFQGTQKYQLEFNTEFKEKIISIDKDQMVQVLNNLIKNAIQSFQNRGHGKIKVLLENNEKKSGVIISINDDGCGIDPENKKRVFIPRFTTKSTGSGIGLSLVKQIIENHGGEVSFSSKEGEGSVFSFYLPD